jgi:YVTN family beta-propeller protein
MTLDNMTLTDIFCSSQIILPQSGEILIAGGDNWTGSGTTNTGNNNTNLFDFGDNTLARSANMNRSRWYSSSTALVNGEIYIQGGSGGADRPEVRQVDGAFRLLTDAPTNTYATLFPRNFLAPDGRVFGYDSNAKMYFVDTSSTGSLTPAGQFSSAYVGWTSGAAMFRPGKILQMGGNSTGAVVVDITGPEPVVTPTASLSSQRHWVSATVLADGQVIATGGSASENKLTGVNNKAEIWNPDTGQWHVGPEGALARLYHSSALLLPDASVLVAGGGAPGPLKNTNAEIYYPPYLYDTDGGFATRPQILSAPTTADVGDSLAVQIDSSVVSRVTLVKSGSVTHSVNMDQRFLELPFSASGNMLNVELPDRASDTPPGYYLLFVIDDAGVPSVSRMLRINVDATPNVAVDYTPAIGGGGGSPFQLACSVDEVLVGVHGQFNVYVNQIGPQCVQMDQFGDPVDGPVTGSTTSGTSFSKTCPRDFGVSGFRGWSDQYVNQVEIECRPLTATGGLSGDGELLGPDGGNGGNSQGLQRCGTDNPAHALYGRSGGWLDSFGLQCKEAFVTTISVNSTPVIVNPGTQSGVVGTPVDLQIGASDGDGDDLTFSVLGLPTGLTLNADTGRISGVPAADGTFNVSVTVTDGTESDDVVFDWTVAPAPPLVVAPMPPQIPLEVDSVADYTASSSGGVNVVYQWNFGDGTPETTITSSPSVSHTFAEPGIFYVTLTVVDDSGSADIQTFVQGIHRPHTTDSPASSSNIVYESRSGENSRIWVVNQDNDSVSVFDTLTHTRISEIPVGVAPRSIAIAPDGRLWVTNKMSANISVIDPVSLGVSQTLAMPLASQPYGIVCSPTASEAYVALEASSQLLKLDAVNGGRIATVATGPHPRHVAIDGPGSNVYVSLFITPPQPGEHTGSVESQVGGIMTGGQIQVVDSSTMTVSDTVVLRHSELPDAENQGRGVPNYLGAVAISPDGLSARVPSKQDNVARGELRDPGFNLNFQNTVRAISSRILLDSNTEDYSRRIDYDNSRNLCICCAGDQQGSRGGRRLRLCRIVSFRCRQGATGPGRVAGWHATVRQQLHGSHGRCF